eukprot:m.96352 g.96352  ORF g.96352 m.96352 type:complete len:364 (+) comp26888_c0_seq5:248-1339(+)
MRMMATSEEKPRVLSASTSQGSLRRIGSNESRLSSPEIRRMSAPGSPRRPDLRNESRSSVKSRSSSSRTPERPERGINVSPLQSLPSVKSIRDRCGDDFKATPPPAFDVPDWVDRISVDSRDELVDPPSYRELLERLHAAEAKVKSLESQLDQWQTAAREALNAIALSPTMNERYKQRVSEQLTKILAKVPQVQQVNFINCSFPAVSTQAPRIALISWESIDRSTWWVKWEPSWSVEVSLGGRHYVPFTLSLRVSNIRVQGQFSLKLLSSLHYFWVSFNKDIKVEMSIDVDLVVGILSVPLQATVEELVRKGFDEWLRNSLVEPNRMRIPLLVKKDETQNGMSDEDFEAARVAAETAMQRASM